MEKVPPFPKSPNWLLAPVEDLGNLFPVTAFDSNLVCARCAGSRGLNARLAVIPAQRFAQRELTLAQIVANR